MSSVSQNNSPTPSPENSPGKARDGGSDQAAAETPEELEPKKEKPGKRKDQRFTLPCSINNPQNKVVWVVTDAVGTEFLSGAKQGEMSARAKFMFENYLVTV